jgi:hypothetical protein
LYVAFDIFIIARNIKIVNKNIFPLLTAGERPPVIFPLERVAPAVIWSTP